MDAKSKKSSLTSGSVYMSANEIELGSMKESSSDLNKPPKSDSHTEKIDEVNEEITNVAVVSGEESETEISLEPNEQDKLLKTPEVEIPNSPSQEIREQEIETTFTVAPADAESDKEADSLLNHPTEEPLSPAADVLLRIRELISDYGIFIAGFFLLIILLVFLVGVLPQCFHSLYYDEVIFFKEL